MERQKRVLAIHDISGVGKCSLTVALPIISAAGDYMTQTVAVKLAGFGAGLLFGVISSYVVYRAAAALNPKRLLFVFVIQAGAMFIQQGIFLVQVLMARHILDSAALLSIMAPIIDRSSWLIFIIFFGIESGFIFFVFIFIIFCIVI